MENTRQTFAQSAKQMNQLESTKVALGDDPFSIINKPQYSKAISSVKMFRFDSELEASR